MRRYDCAIPGDKVSPSDGDTAATVEDKLDQALSNGNCRQVIPPRLRIPLTAVPQRLDSPAGEADTIPLAAHARVPAPHGARPTLRAFLDMQALPARRVEFLRAMVRRNSRT